MEPPLGAVSAILIIEIVCDLSSSYCGVGCLWYVVCFFSQKGEQRVTRQGVEFGLQDWNIFWFLGGSGPRGPKCKQKK